MIPGETILSAKALVMKVDSHVGPFKVIRSQGSGLFYIGTMWLACGDSTCEDCSQYHRTPSIGDEIDYNSRETDYFEKEEDATKALERFKETGVLFKMRT